MSVDGKDQWYEDTQEECGEGFCEKFNRDANFWFECLTTEEFIKLMQEHGSPYQAKVWGFINSDYKPTAMGPISDLFNQYMAKQFEAYCESMEARAYADD